MGREERKALGVEKHAFLAGDREDCLVGFVFVWGFFCYFTLGLVCPKIFLGKFSSHHDGQTCKYIVWFLVYVSWVSPSALVSSLLLLLS